MEDLVVYVPEMSPHQFQHPYFSLENSHIYIKTGYAWDGVSGPTIDTDNTFVAGIVHDALYQAMREKLLPASAKDEADKIFRRILREKGMSWVRSEYFYLAVKWFGKAHIKTDKNVEKIFEVR